MARGSWLVLVIALSAGCRAEPRCVRPFQGETTAPVTNWERNYLAYRTRIERRQSLILEIENLTRERAESERVAEPVFYEDPPEGMAESFVMNQEQMADAILAEEDASAVSAGDAGPATLSPSSGFGLSFQLMARESLGSTRDHDRQVLRERVAMIEEHRREEYRIHEAARRAEADAFDRAQAGGSSLSAAPGALASPGIHKGTAPGAAFAPVKRPRPELSLQREQRHELQERPEMGPPRLGPTRRNERDR